MNKSEVLDFVKSNNLAVVATSDQKRKPQAAVVEFGELEDLTIIINTLKTSRKYKNLEQNKDVAIVIGWDDDITVQIDAIATELSGDDLEKAKLSYFKRTPEPKSGKTDLTSLISHLSQSGCAIQMSAKTPGKSKKYCFEQKSVLIVSSTGWVL